jgi:type IV pilus assembly protein PilC
MFFVVGGVLVGVVFPQIGSIFEESGVTLPFVTRALLIIGNFVANWWIAIVAVTIILIALLLDYGRSKEGRGVYDQLSVQIPVIGKLFRKVYVARFAESTSVLIKGGIPITQAIEISSHNVGNAIYKELLQDAAEGVRRGELLSRLMEKNEDYFPPIVGQMISVGESTGTLDEMLSRLAKFYEREVDDLVGNLVELIQPALMVVVGVMTGLLFASILLPIYNLVQVF